MRWQKSKKSLEDDVNIITNNVMNTNSKKDDKREALTLTGCRELLGLTEAEIIKLQQKLGVLVDGDFGSGTFNSMINRWTEIESTRPDSCIRMYDTIMAHG